jgi:xylulokinase
MKVIAYDVGTTGLKTCLFDISAEESVRYIDGEVEQYDLYILPNGGAEQDPKAWWDAMCKSTKRLLAKTGLPKEAIKGISFCSQMQTVVMVDEHGCALRRAMSCMDTRANKQFRRCMGTGIQVEGLDIVKVLRFMKITGAASASAKDPAWKYQWIQENEPEVYAKTYKWLDAKEYLTSYATGYMRASRDDACLTFLYDVKKRCWSKVLCKMLNVDMRHLPELIESTDRVGELLKGPAQELGLAEGTPVFAGGGDLSLCQLGAGCTDVGDVNVYSGTSGWVCTTVDKLHLDIGNVIASVVGAGTNTYNYVAESETAGKCMDWSRDRIERMGMSFDDLFDYIKDTPAGSNGVVFSPWMHGNRCPFEDSNARGLFFNIDVDSHGSDLIKSVIEGVCLHMRWMLEATEETFKTRPTVRFTGGSAMSPLIAQILSDVLGREVETVENPRLVGAMGAAALMAVSLKLIDKVGDIKNIIRVSGRYIPNSQNHAVYNKIYPIFKNLYFDNKKAFAALNR